MDIAPRKPTDRGGYLMMPLVKNIPEPKHLEWKRTTCPGCGRECWERPLPEGFDKESFDGALCTECALRAV